MKISVCKDATVVVEGDSSAITDYLQAEYAGSAAPESPDEMPDIRIELVDDQSDAMASKAFSPRVSRDGYGVYLNDGHDRCLRLDFASLSGESWHATCDWDFDPLVFDSLLTQLVQLRLLCRGQCLLPAAAFEQAGRTVLMAGGPSSGKTNLLLSFVAEGALFLADDRVALGRDGKVTGLGKRLHITYRNLEAFPDLAQRLSEPAAAMMNFLGYTRSGEVEVSPALVQHLETSLRSEVAPADLLDRTLEPGGSTLDTLLLLDQRPWERGIVKTESVDPGALVGCLTALFERGLEDLLLAYRVYREQTGQQAELLDAWRPACEGFLTEAVRRSARACRVQIPAHYAAGAAPQAVCALLEDESAPGALLQKAG